MSKVLYTKLSKEVMDQLDKSLSELSLETTNKVGLIPQKSCQLIVCCLNEVNPNSIALFSSLNKSLQDDGEIRVIYHKLAKESY